MPRVGFLVTVFLLIAAALLSRARAQNETTALALAEKIARSHGLAHFANIEVLEYTFNAARGGKTVSRHWRWLPQTDEVYYQGPGPEGKPISFHYKRSQLKADSSKLIRFVDQRFINDQYWLLFPLHLVWDREVQLLYDGKAPFPIPPGEGPHLIVRYGNVGYTPGDVYELFVDSNYRLRQWIFRRGGSKKPTLICTWEGYVKLGPLWIATQHWSADRSFHLWFTDLRLRMATAQIWLEPEKMPE
ncbi:MAG: hypothetical protein D6715_03775 [Calditrichaeota bacterium]|nr:MAG: hypothetical protein D6715_03775 [Calditrichota bacterium]